MQVVDNFYRERKTLHCIAETILHDHPFFPGSCRHNVFLLHKGQSGSVQEYQGSEANDGSRKQVSLFVNRTFA